MNNETTTCARLRELFERCVDMAQGEREAWLDANVADSGLRIELELMIAADAHDGGLLQRDVASLVGTMEQADDDFDPASLIGRRYGAFRLVQLVGRGGQGSVYRAERADGDFVQVVAVKLLRRGLHDSAEHRRFRRERDILARLDDPGVARLIDGGISDEGIPYLVMDFVDGEPLDRWCRRNAPTMRDRLALFQRLCAIVAVAHRSLIVHRDLKPSNVLITATGEVRVLDFGIARLLDEDQTDAQTVVPMLTPGYGAPEQRDAGAITPATDVYALGVLLRQMLTGQAPNAARKARPATTDMSAHLPRELAWVIARACDAEPARRYRDATELDEDVTRFLSSRPVLAHPPSSIYTLRKFVRRHRGGALTTIALATALLASMAFALWQAHVARMQGLRAVDEAARATTALARAEAVRDFIVDVFETAGAGLPRDRLPDTATLLERGRSAALAGAKASPEVQVDMLALLGRIQLGLQHEDRALVLVNDALNIAQAQAPRDEGSIAGLLALRGELHGRLGRFDDSINDFDDALARRTAGGADELDVARILVARGEQNAAAGHATAAIADYERALAIEAQQPATPVTLLAQTRNGYGIALWRAGDCVRGESQLREAVDLSRVGWGDDHAETAGALSGLSLCLTQNLAFDESEAVSRESLAILTRVFGADHPALGQSRNNLANLLARIGKLREAEPLLRRKLAADRATGVDEAGSGLNTWINLSNVLRNRGDLQGALDAALTAQRIGRRVADDAPVGHEPDLLLARIALAKSDLPAAQRAVDAFRQWQKTAEGAHVMLPARVDLLEARIALQRGHLATAESLVTRALPDAEKLGCTDGARGYGVAADLRHEQGRDDEALALLDRAVALCHRVGTPRHFACGEALLARAELRLLVADRAGADADAASAAAALGDELLPDHPDRRRLSALVARLGQHPARHGPPAG